MKTRALAAWAENRGFKTAICERMFDASFRRRDDEPAVALCGIDNAHGRRALDQVGFDAIEFKQLVPEPTSLALLEVGSTLLLARRQMRRAES